jgi:molybdopterin/thiamine biosynthesis adenylyltransferase
VVAASQPEIRSHRERWSQRTQPNPGDILLINGVGGRRGRLQAWIQRGGREQQITHIRLPGSGMHRVATHENPSEGTTEGTPGVQKGLSASRWSRTIGALTEEVWRRLVRLRIGLVGCGRLGSLLATSLARTGVSEWVLVDPDGIERHNLGESAGWTKEDLGTSKAEGLARHLARICPGVQAPEAVPHSVSMEPARRALRKCDVLLCCADAGSGRLATGILAALYHLPLLDVGTGVFSSGQTRDIGAEIRLVLPGDGCLQCTGGTARPGETRTALQRPDAEKKVARDGDWTDERAGSLRSWNTVVVGAAQRILESLVAEDIGQSGWWRLRWSENALQHQRQDHSSTSEECLCSLAGRGDEGISEVQARMREHG